MLEGSSAICWWSERERDKVCVCVCVCASVKNTEVFFLYLEKQTVKYEKEGRGEREGEEERKVVNRSIKGTKVCQSDTCTSHNCQNCHGSEICNNKNGQ